MTDEVVASVEEGAQAPSDAPEGSTSVLIEPVVDVPVVFDLNAHKALLAASVDDYISAIYSRFTRFDMEYVKREEAARAFIADPTGEAGVWVEAFSTNAGIPVDTAAQLIIQQAGQLRNALEVLGSLRMKKYGIFKATTKEDADSVKEDVFAAVEVIAKTL
jgi:hypothetical protein